MTYEPGNSQLMRGETSAWGRALAARAAYEQGQRDALNGAVQRVEALAWAFIHSTGELITRAEAVAAIKGDHP
jgi:hypothetical protein